MRNHILTHFLTWFAIGFTWCPDAHGDEGRITFVKQLSQPGQTMTQQAFVHSATIQTYEQSNQIISETDREIRNTQVRKITTIALDPPTVQVSYEVANLRIGKNRLLAKKESQPVENKSYRVSRIAGELHIEDSAGNQPPIDERRIVESTMNWVGQPNALVEFLNGRTVTVDETLELPPDIAAKIFGGAMGMAFIQRASLTLQKIKRVHGSKSGQFGIMFIGTPTGDDEKQTEVHGEICVEGDTCRTVRAEVKSDLDASEQRGPVGATFTVRNRGKVRIAIEAEFEKSL